MQISAIKELLRQISRIINPKEARQSAETSESETRHDIADDGLLEEIGSRLEEIELDTEKNAEEGEKNNLKKSSEEGKKNNLEKSSEESDIIDCKEGLRENINGKYNEKLDDSVACKTEKLLDTANGAIYEQDDMTEPFDTANGAIPEQDGMTESFDTANGAIYDQNGMTEPFDGKHAGNESQENEDFPSEKKPDETIKAKALKEHLVSSVPRTARLPKGALTKGEIAEIRSILGNLDDAEIHRLYRRVTK